MADILRARIFAIACDYEDANDLDRLRTDPAFRLACGRLSDSGLDLCSQPTCSRLENLPELKTAIRLGDVLVDLWLSTRCRPPETVALDIHDTPYFEGCSVSRDEDARLDGEIEEEPGARSRPQICRRYRD